jgi:hypothetical protein
LHEADVADVVVASSPAISNMTNNSSKAKVRTCAAPVFSEAVAVVADKAAVVTKIRIPLPRLRVPLPTVAT